MGFVLTTLYQIPMPYAVEVFATTLPKGVLTESRRGHAVAWWMTTDDCLWMVVFDDTGEVVWVPQYELRLRSNWSLGRRRHEVGFRPDRREVSRKGADQA